MICPNCQSNMSDKRKRCERCGTDLTLYKKILRASNQYYNSGLARAKVRDLSGSIISLRNSLELNKKNTNARNLLGLIYYEMGETVAALSEWVISKHFQAEDNDADEYINKVQSNPTKLDSQNQAIKRYNNALSFAKQGNDDLAIIQLKKVLTLNVHFIRAFHLLSLLYMKAGEKDKARKSLMKASRIDVSNTTTLRYLQELEIPAVISADNNPEGEHNNTPSAIIPISSYKEDKPNIMAFVNLVIGVVIGLAVFAILIMPSIKKNLTANQNSDYVSYSEGLAQQEQKQDTINSLQKDKDELTRNNQNLQKQISELQTQIDNSASEAAIYNPLFQAVDQFIDELNKTKVSDRDFTKIADILLAVDEKKFTSTDAVALLNLMKESTYPMVADAQYEQGYSDYSRGKYEEALVELKKVMEFDPTNVSAIYFTARSYHRLKDYDNAKIYYNIIVTDFSDSNRATDAKSFLNELQE